MLSCTWKEHEVVSPSTQTEHDVVSASTRTEHDVVSASTRMEHDVVSASTNAKHTRHADSDDPISDNPSDVSVNYRSPVSLDLETSSVSSLSHNTFPTSADTNDFMDGLNIRKDIQQSIDASLETLKEWTGELFLDVLLDGAPKVERINVLKYVGDRNISHEIYTINSRY